jgi:hypothetical protein
MCPGFLDNPPRQWKCTFHWRFLKKTASENALFTGGSKMLISTDP